MTHESSISAYFDARAGDGSAAFHETLLGDVAEQVLGAMEVKPGQQLIDLGCGVGWATKRLGKKAPGAQAVGIDFAPEMIARADSETDWTSRARFERMGIEAIDFPDGKFDHAFALEALEFCQDPVIALREVARVLRPGAAIEVIIRRFDGSPGTEDWAEALGVPLPWMSPEEWNQAVTDAGFELTSASIVQDRRDFVPFEPNALWPEESIHGAIVSAGCHWIRARR